MKRQLLLSAFLLGMITWKTQAQVGIGTTSPHNSAMLEVKSTTRGFLAPRMTASERTAIVSPAVGLTVYQTDGAYGFYYYDGTGWIMLINSVDPLPAVNGSAVTSLNASNIATGTVPLARLGSGTPTGSNYLRGDGTWAAPTATVSAFPVTTVNIPSGTSITTTAIDLTTATALNNSKRYLVIVNLLCTKSGVNFKAELYDGSTIYAGLSTPGVAAAAGANDYCSFTTYLTGASSITLRAAANTTRTTSGGTIQIIEFP